MRNIVRVQTVEDWRLILLALLHVGHQNSLVRPELKKRAAELAHELADETRRYDDQGEPL